MMRKRHIFQMVLAVTVLTLFSHCSSDDDNTETPLALTKRLLINGTWKVKSLTIDDVDKTADYAAMELTFAEDTYKASNSGKVWPASGVWTLKDEKTINRDNEIDVHIEKLDEQQLTLSLDQDIAFEEGRTATLGGHLVYELVKK